MALPVTITGLSTSVATVGPFKVTRYLDAWAGGVLDPNVTNVFGNASGTTKRAQKFIVGSSSLINPTFKCFVRKSGAPTDNLVVSIYTNSGSSPGSQVSGTSTSTGGSSLSTTVQTEISFQCSATLNANTTYWLVFERSGANDGTNYYHALRASNSYADGEVHTLNGSSWSLSSYEDLFFSISSPTVSDEYYFLGVDSTNNYALDVYKATDPTSSWSQVTTANTTSNLQIVQIAAYQSGDSLHIACAIAASAGSTDYRYYVYNMASETFTISNETIEAGIDTWFNSGQARHCSISVRSDGDVIVVYNGDADSVMGTAYRRIDYARREAGVWTTAVAVDSAGSVHWMAPEIVGPDASDRMALIWSESGGSGFSYMRSLSSGNVLQTQQGGTNIGGAVLGLQGTIYQYNGNDVVVVGCSGSLWYFNSADNPTINLASNVVSTYPMSIFSDNGIAYALYNYSSTGDLYVKSSSDGGASWSPASPGTLAFTGTVATSIANLSRDGNIYLRGNDYVIPYVVNDNGTLKYNEYVVRSLATPKSLIFNPLPLLPLLVR